MDTVLQAHVAHYLTGNGPAPGLDAIEGLGLRPALMARHRDLASLRYDYPLVLADRPTDGVWVISLSGLFDRLYDADERGTDADRRRHAALRLEREIRRAVATGGAARLSLLWDDCARRLGGDSDAELRGDLASLKAASQVDGWVADCDRDLPARLVTHAWAFVEANKAHTARRSIDRLVRRLSDILLADEAHSAPGVSEERLRASFGDTFGSEVNFGALSKLLSAGLPDETLPRARRTRIQRALQALQSQRFFVADDETGPGGSADATGAYGFVFDTCSDALATYRGRLPELADLAEAMLVAELEADGAYRDVVHDPLFEGDGAVGLGPSQVFRLPGYLVMIREDRLTGAEVSALLDALALGMPLKVLLQTDDLASPRRTGNGQPGAGLSVADVCGAAVGMGDAFVVQSASSHLYRMRERIQRGLAYEGATLLGVYSGAGGSMGSVPPYVVAAAAVESRVFPSLAYDPSAGPDWRSRCFVGDNPQPERDWPEHELAYEDEALQRQAARVAFTAVDFLAGDMCHAEHLARVGADGWIAGMVPVDEVITREPSSIPDQVPYVWMADANGGVHRVLVDRPLVEAAARYRERWLVLRELGGVRNSFAEHAVANERAAWEEQRARESEAGLTPGALAPAPDGISATSEVLAQADAVDEAAAARRRDEAWIETARCSTCNECTQINPNMFKYNRNKQAYIADLSAGTYAQLVTAAERCQVAVIHPGKPTNPDEPGLEELLQRAETFR